MATEITMPQLSDTMDQGTILTWLKQEGDPVERGDALAEVATDKADLEIECFHEGVILRIFSPVGSTVKVGEVIAVVGEAGEKVSEPAPAASAPEVEESVAAPKVEAPAATPAPASTAPATASVEADVAVETPAASVAGERVKISPLAKNLAESRGVDYSQLNGSGDGGRIIKKDVESHLGTSFTSSDVEAAVSGQSPIAQTAPAQQAPKPQTSTSSAPSAPVVSGQSSIAPLSKMRAAIANQMVKSTTEIPHFYVAGKCEVDALIEMRSTLKPLPQYEGITFNHLIMKAVALTLRAFPRINSCYRDGSLVEPQDVNIGIVTALEDGLLIPVVKNVDQLPLSDLVSESRSLVQRARAARPKADDLSGGTFSISNIGRSEVEQFTAIINPSQGAILAVGSIQEEALVKAGNVVPGNVMRLTLSVDHRIIDGVVAGEFMTHLKHLIENPVLILA
jgi:pyruvate dehydrogenase E2 component (dihydrolipoamide acetyltransferase)